MSVLLIKQSGLDTLNVKLIKFGQTLYAVWGWWTRRRRRGDGGRLSETVWRMSLEVFAGLGRMHSIASNGEGRSRAQSANPGLPGKIATVIRYSQGNATFFYRNGAYKCGRRHIPRLYDCIGAVTDQWVHLSLTGKQRHPWSGAQAVTAT